MACSLEMFSENLLVELGGSAVDDMIIGMGDLDDLGSYS